MRYLLVILTLAMILYGCDSSGPSNSADVSKYVRYILKLPSPNGKSALYSYYLKYPQARHGHTFFTIQADSTKFEAPSDAFTFSDTLYGFNILGWQGDTIRAVCIVPSQHPNGDLQPYKIEIIKWKNWYWQLNYHWANSFGGGTKRYFDSMVYSKDSIIFTGQDTILGQVEPFRIAALKGEVIVPLGDTIISVHKLNSFGGENRDTTKITPMVSLESSILQPIHTIDWKRLRGFGVFVEQQPTK
jgi:hypothetical protein